MRAAKWPGAYAQQLYQKGDRWVGASGSAQEEWVTCAYSRRRGIPACGVAPSASAFSIFFRSMSLFSCVSTAPPGARSVLHVLTRCGQGGLALGLRAGGGARVYWVRRQRGRASPSPSLSLHIPPARSPPPPLHRDILDACWRGAAGWRAGVWGQASADKQLQVLVVQTKLHAIDDHPVE